MVDVVDNTLIHATDEASLRYPGWRVLIACVIGMIFSSGPMLFGSMGLFVEYFEGEFGWTRGGIMLSLTLNTIATIVAAPICGRLIDRFGARKVLLPSILVFAALWASVPMFTGELGHLYLIISLIGFFTVGTQSISYIRVVSAWFDKKRGLAIGITASGLGLSYMLTPLIVQTVLEYRDWRYAYWTMAAMILLISFPTMYFFIRNGPADAVSTVANPSTPKEKALYGLTLREALQTREFWVISFALLLFSLLLTGFVPHIVPIMTERGLSVKAAAQTASIMGFATFVGRIGVGYLIDRIFAPYVAIVFFASAAGGFLILASGSVGPVAMIAAMMIGLGFGAESDLIGYFVSRYFGLRSFGEIYGYIYGAFLIGAGAGPLLLGIGHDRLGSYISLLTVFSIVAAAGCTLFLLLRPFPNLEGEQVPC
ncbi:MAG: MFS transporter [Proteobacteria bacterium]|nr:MAG: MFS transporter [Pseudomonadota bacterium]